VYPEIFNKIRQFLAVSYLTFTNKPCHLWSYQAKVNQIFRRCSPIISAVNAYMHTMILQFVFSTSLTNASGISRRLVAMTTSLDKLENEVQIHHLHVERFHTVKRLRKSVQYVRRYSTKCASFVAVSYLTFTNKPYQL